MHRLLWLIPLAGALGLAVTAHEKLSNPRVKVSEVIYQPGQPRERYTRPTDQLIVFLDDCRYQRIDSASGEKTVRERKSGEVLWHHKGEDAPVLINLGSKPYRTLVIELR